MQPLIAAYKKTRYDVFNTGMGMRKMPNYCCSALFNYYNY